MELFYVHKCKSSKDIANFLWEVIISQFSNNVILHSYNAVPLTMDN